MNELEPQSLSQIEELPASEGANVVNIDDILPKSQGIKEVDSFTNNPVEAINTSEPTIESTALPHQTAERRIASFLNNLADKVEKSGDKRIERQDRSKQAILKFGYSALIAAKNAGYITVGLGIMGVESVTKGATTIKEGAIGAKYTAVGLGIMGKEAAVQGVKNTHEFASNKINDIKEKTLDKVQEVKSSISEKIYETRKNFIQKSAEAKQRRDERKDERKAIDDKLRSIAEQAASDRNDRIAADSFAREERAAVAKEQKAKRKMQYKELYAQTTEKARNTTSSAREIGRLATGRKRALADALMYN